MNRDKIVALILAASLATSQIPSDLTFALDSSVEASYNEDVISQDVKDSYSKINEIVSISDSALRRVIKETLNIANNELTIGDMYKLTSIVVEENLIISLDGLQYAKNLESIEIEYSEITDLSPLKDLTKLTDISITKGYIAGGMAKSSEGKIVIKEDIIDITGEKLIPKEIKIGNSSGSKTIEVSNNIENGVILIGESNFYNGINSIVIVYEGANGLFHTESIYMFMK